MRIGLVCPYSLDVPGGVQNHVRDLAGELAAAGHEVSVLAPGEPHDQPAGFTTAGRAVPVPYNGSIARLTFGPLSRARTRRWLREGGFDVVHVHEPATPSLSMLAMWATQAPLVATFHTAMEHSYALEASAGLLRPGLAKLRVRIAVSEQARMRVRPHVGPGTIVIPNGIHVDRFAGSGSPRGMDRRRAGPVVFLGRYDEPRKGLGVLLDALPAIWAQRPAQRVVVAGIGDAPGLRRRIPSRQRELVTVRTVDDDQRTRVLNRAAVYVAPQLGGESFGVVLLEAMASGAPVVASGLPAFCDLLEDGRWGRLFRTGDPQALARSVLAALDDPGAARQAARSRAMVRRYDWSQLTGRLLEAYDGAIARPLRRPIDSA